MTKKFLKLLNAEIDGDDLVIDLGKIRIKKEDALESPVKLRNNIKKRGKKIESLFWVYHSFPELFSDSQD